MQNISENDFKILFNGTITSVPEFYASATHCGIKKSNKDDICVIYTPLNTVSSAVFTTNKFSAAPVEVCKEQLKHSRDIKAIIVNSGIANACTGKQGYDNAFKTIEIASKCLNVSQSNILVSSTGVIGKNLPMEKVASGIDFCSNNLKKDGGHAAAGAILTTDKYEKEIAVKIGDENSNFFIGGIAKGSGMIEPNMATMLCFVTTNVAISPELLDDLLKESVMESFNSITIDGCQSTNDMVVIQANGQSRIEIKKNSTYFLKFKKALDYVLKFLAKQIVKDGEGATKMININVRNAKTKLDAKNIGLKVANSNLFKTAIFGEDLNWGRITAAMGSSDLHFIPEKVDIYLFDVAIVKNGLEFLYDEKLVEDFMKKDEIDINIDLKYGDCHASIMTTDLSYEYVKINSKYRT
jgi:glutamate N-acetyltransferase / amino-acid N-acetyltransferase